MSNYFHKNVRKRSKAKRQARQDKQLTGEQAKTVKRMIGS